MSGYETQILQDELKILLDKSGRSYQWLSEKLHMPKDNIYFALNRATKLDTSLYIAIKSVLENFTGCSVNCDNLTGKTMLVGSNLNEEISKLFHSVGLATQDGKLTQTEKLVLVAQLKDMQNNINNQLSEMLKLLGEK